MLHHVVTAKQETEDPWGSQVEHWGNLLFRLETKDLDWSSRVGLVVAVKNFVCLPAHFDVPDLVTAFRCNKAHQNYIKKHTAMLCPSLCDSHVLVKCG